MVFCLSDLFTKNIMSFSLVLYFSGLTLFNISSFHKCRELIKFYHRNCETLTEIGCSLYVVSRYAKVNTVSSLIPLMLLWNRSWTFLKATFLFWPKFSLFPLRFNNSSYLTVNDITTIVTTTTTVIFYPLIFIFFLWLS